MCNGAEIFHEFANEFVEFCFIHFSHDRTLPICFVAPLHHIGAGIQSIEDGTAPSAAFAWDVRPIFPRYDVVSLPLRT